MSIVWKTSSDHASVRRASGDHYSVRRLSGEHGSVRHFDSISMQCLVELILMIAEKIQSSNNNNKTHPSYSHKLVIEGLLIRVYPLLSRFPTVYDYTGRSYWTKIWMKRKYHDHNLNGRHDYGRLKTLSSWPLLDEVALIYYAFKLLSLSRKLNCDDARPGCFESHMLDNDNLISTVDESIIRAF